MPVFATGMGTECFHGPDLIGLGYLTAREVQALYEMSAGMVQPTRIVCSAFDGATLARTTAKLAAANVQVEDFRIIPAPLFQLRPASARGPRPFMVQVMRQATATLSAATAIVLRPICRIVYHR